VRSETMHELRILRGDAATPAVTTPEQRRGKLYRAGYIDGFQDALEQVWEILELEEEFDE